MKAHTSTHPARSFPMNHRLACLPLFFVLLVPSVRCEAETLAPDAAPDKAQSRFTDLLEWSREHKRGLTLYVNGLEIHGVVREVLADAVVLSNQERRTIIIRREQIDAVAGQ